MDEREALYLGLLSSMAGIPFRGMALVAAADASLAASTAEALRAHNAQTVDTILRVEAILGKHGLPRPPRPQTLADYTQWLGAVSQASGGSLPPESAAAGALLIGSFAGDLIANLSVGVILLTLLAKPRQTLLDEAVRLAGLTSLATSRRGMALRHPALSPRARPTAESLLALAQAAPVIDGLAATPERIEALRQNVAALRQKLAELLDAFQPGWLLLRIPRAGGPLSAVLSSGAVETGATIGEVIDKLLPRGPAPATLVFPLDGRHALAGAALEEAQRRGFAFSRHLPPGEAHWLLDPESTDAAPDLSGEALAALLEKLGGEAGEAARDAELGEAMGILRQIVAVCARHSLLWDKKGLWALGALIEVAGATGNDDNLREAGELIRHALSQPPPAAMPSPVLFELGQVAHKCARAGDPTTGVMVFRTGVELARRLRGDGHSDHLGMINNYGQFLTAVRHPDAEPVLRDLLARVRAANLPHVAVVLTNLALALESLGRAEEAKALQAEAAAIGG
jgi:hypothetical protein